MYNRFVLIALGLIAAFAAVGCNGDQPADDRQNANQQVKSEKPGHWVAQYRSPASKAYEASYLAFFSYNDISVVSSKVVFVAGEIPGPKGPSEFLGVVVRTTDGGETWTESPVEQPGLKVSRLNSIFFVDPNLGWVVGIDSKDAGVILKTTDGGATWAASKIGFKQIPTRVFFHDANAGWMVGANPRLGEDEGGGGPSDILSTTDGGATWQSKRRISVSLHDIFFLDRMTGWAGGTDGAIYHTTDGGQSWNTQRSEVEPGTMGPSLTPESRMKFAIRGIRFVDKEHGWASVAEEEDDEAGRILATTNGGEVWTRQRIVDGSGVAHVFFLDGSTGWAATNQGQYIHYSQDGGLSWTGERVEFEQKTDIYRLGAASASHAWAVGGGAIFYRVTE
ncbi:MAG: YCF48-related protein [Blastocatellia bacterium]|nr:YCF48-related protein [Blastocatellia bacterium]